MMKLDDEVLMAYVDGELDSQRVAEVEAILAEDAEARATAQMFRESAATLGNAFDNILREPVPARLLAAINAPSTGPVSDVRLARPQRRGGFFFSTISWAQAALVALVVGAGSGYLAARWLPGGSEPLLMIAAMDPLLNQALENTASGAPFVWRQADGELSREILPMLTFRDASNRYCREFESSLITAEDRQISDGLACRAHGVWQLRALLDRQVIASAILANPALEPGQYAPAMSGDVASFDAVIQQMMVGKPLSAAEEAAALKQGWR